MRRFSLTLLLVTGLFIMTSCGNGDTEEYASDLEGVVSDMLDTASKVESMLNDYASVWSHTIKSKGAIPVDEMASVTGLEVKVIKEHFVINSMGNIPDDFSTNIHSLNDYFDSVGELEDIKSSRNDIKDRVSELNDPPNEYEKVYDEMLDMYNHFMEYVDMALSPSGSLQGFNDDRSHLSSEIINKYNRIEVIFPGKD